MNVLVKVCGLTEPAIAEAAANLGVNYIGLLFSSLSPRQVDLNLAKQITAATRNGGADVVGVFVDECVDKIKEIIAYLDLRIIQLHGAKVRAYCNELAHQVKIIYVISDQIDQVIPSTLSPEKDFLLFENTVPLETNFRYFIAGKLNSNNIEQKLSEYRAYGVDLSSGLEFAPGKKDIKQIQQFISLVRTGYYGAFGGMYVPELLMTPLAELAKAYEMFRLEPEFKTEYLTILSTYLGRPTPVTEVKNFAQAIQGPRVFLKREDLLHTGAHKINNAVGQCLLAKKMGKTRVIAETGAGQHGLATATACAMFGLECVVYMGATDIKRQAPNVEKMQLLGAIVVPVSSGSATLKDAVNEALRDWAQSYDNTHYCLGSALGPYPFPKIVADFQSVIGVEAKQQMLQLVGKHPDAVVACVGGGSNAIGIFSAYIDVAEVKLIGVEAGGIGGGLGNNAARFQEGSIGVLHGTKTYLLQDQNRQVVDTYSISAGLDYPAVGPQHAHLFDTKRATYTSVTDDEAVAAFKLLVRTEGIIPALESSHALAYVIKNAQHFNSQGMVLVNLSGRGDKDLHILLTVDGSDSDER